jgi:head-tail adaptor
MQAGQLSERFSFEKRAAAVDGYGNFQGDWERQFVVAARRKMLVGGETVMAARLSGRQPAVLTIRNSTQARTITTDWRAVDTRSGDVWNIRSVTPIEDRSGIDLLVERGVAP